MNKRFARALAAPALLLLAATAHGQKPETDLTVRRALYFTGARTDAIDTKNDSRITEGGLMVLKKSDGANCTPQGCSFNFGFFVMRSPAAEGLHTDAMVQAVGGNPSDRAFDFKEREAVREVVVPVRLRPGATKLTVRVDPFNNTHEKDEANNHFSVTVVVKP